MEFRFRIEGSSEDIVFDGAKLAQSNATLEKLRNDMLAKPGATEELVDRELGIRFFDALNRFGEGYVKQMSAVLQHIFQTRDELSGSYRNAVAGNPVSSADLQAKFESLATDMAKLKSPEKALNDAGDVELPPRGEAAAEADLSTNFATDAELDAIFDHIEDEADVPRVKDGKIDGKSVRRSPKDPVKRAAWFRRRNGRINIWDLVLRPPESYRGALLRVLKVIGTDISEHVPLRDAWNDALEYTLDGRPLTSITREEMLGQGAYEGKGLYDRTRDQFWKLVRRSDARNIMEDAGLMFGTEPAPNLEVTASDVPINELKVSLDHKLEKAQGENWRLAVDPANLKFEFLAPNSFREAVQVRLKFRVP